MADFNTGLRAFYLADELVGTDDLIDATGGTDLTKQGIKLSTPAAGKIGGSRFATDQRYFSGDSAALDLHTGNQSYTVSLWVSLTNTLSTRVFLSRWESLKWEWYISFTGSTTKKVGLYVRSDVPTVPLVWSVNTLGSVGVWYMIVAGYDADNNVTFISVDGEARQEVAFPAGLNIPAAPKSPLFVGVRDSGENAEADAYHDHIGLWSGWAWSNADITEYYNGGAGTSYPFPVVASGTPLSHYYHQHFVRRRRRNP